MTAKENKVSVSSKADKPKATQDKAKTNITVRVQPTTKPPTNPPRTKTKTVRDRELVVRLTGSHSAFAIPLIPGLTLATKLDRLTRDYGWVEWSASPIITHRSLQTNTTTTWAVAIFHDLSMDDVTREGSVIWDATGPAWRTYSAARNFTVKVPLSEIINKRMATHSPRRGTWVLFKRTRADVTAVEHGEIYLQWQVLAGGEGVLAIPPVTFVISKGAFINPISGEKIDGVPHAGPLTHYHFGSDPAPNAKMVQDFIDKLGAVPHEIVRSPTHDITALALTNKSPVRDVVVGFGDKIIGLTAEAVGTAASAGASTLLGKIFAKLGLGVARVGSWLGLMSPTVVDRQMAPDSFASYSGTVTISQGHLRLGTFATLESTPPIILTKVVNTSKMLPVPSTWQEGINYISALDDATTHTLVLAKEQDTDDTLLALTLSGMSAQNATHAVIETIRRLEDHPRILHRGYDASLFLNAAIPTVEVQKPPSDDSPGDVLPDLPNFDPDVDAPGQTVAWSAARRMFSGFVTDNNGTPIVKWLAGWNRPDMQLFFSPPTPKYYYNIRKPWDTENKRALAFHMTLDDSLQGHFLLLQAYNWGDDSCGSWLSFNGGRYFGTVARFGGITESRSLIYVDDVARWNENDVQLVMGQSKMKYFSGDEGRACIFTAFIGAVADETVALNFLSSWVNHSSVVRMRNKVYTKKQEYDWTSFPTHLDFTPRATLPTPLTELDPFGPGFSANYEKYLTISSARAPAWNVDTLPVKVEAGPVRCMVLARWDNQNGWWQHVPIFTHTHTSLSSDWTIAMLMDSTGFVAGTTSYAPTTNILKITPPSNLASGATLLYDIITLAGSNAAAAVASSNYWVDYPAPIAVRRGAYDDPSSMTIKIFGDTSWPTTAVESFGSDIYVCFIGTFYLVKKTAKQQIVDWMYHDAPQSVRKSPNFVADGSSSATSYTDNQCSLTKVVPGNKEYWTFSTTRWPTSTVDRTGYAGAPLRTSCSIFSPSGISVRMIDGKTVVEENQIDTRNSNAKVYLPQLSDPEELKREVVDNTKLLNE